MSMCRVLCCWKMVFAMTSAFSWQNSYYSVFQGQICLLLQVFLHFLLLHSSPLWWKGHLLGVLVLKGLVGLHGTIQLQLLQRYWLEHKLGLLYYWMVCLENKQVILSFLRLHPNTAFRTLMATAFFSKGFLPTVADTMVIWVKFTHSSPP